MKRYKLIKDLPTFKAEDEFYLVENGDLVLSDGDAYKVVYHHKELEKFPNILEDWFEEIPEEYKRWRAKPGGNYRFINDSGYIRKSGEYRHSINKYRYNIGNYFKTEEETEKYSNYLIALQTIKDDAKGFVPDWGNLGQRKYYGFYDHIEKSLERSSNRNFQNQGTIYFKTIEDIKESFDKHHKEWLTVLGVEE